MRHPYAVWPLGVQRSRFKPFDSLTVSGTYTLQDILFLLTYGLSLPMFDNDHRCIPTLYRGGDRLVSILKPCTTLAKLPTSALGSDGLHAATSVSNTRVET
jgi:hypothetical protein